MSLWLECPEAVWTYQPSPPPVLINHYGAEPHLSSWSETSNERRDHDSAQAQKYFIASTFKHTLLMACDHTGEPPYHICIMSSRPETSDCTRSARCFSSDRDAARGPLPHSPSSTGRHWVPSMEHLDYFLDPDGSHGALWPLLSCSSYDGPSEERTYLQVRPRSSLWIMLFSPFMALVSSFMSEIEGRIMEMCVGLRCKPRQRCQSGNCQNMSIFSFSFGA